MSENDAFTMFNPSKDDLRAEIAQGNVEIALLDKELADLRQAMHALKNKNAELSRFVWWVYQVYARNVQELTSGITEACTYETEEKAEKGKYGLPIRCWEYIRYLEEYTAGIYNGTYLDNETSTVVKRDLSDAEIEELGAQEAERKEFCPNCEAEVPCTHEAELYVCDICGEDFAKYIVSRNCNVSDVSMTQDVSTDIKTGQSIEKETCSWIQEDDPEICYWKTGCGNSFYFTEGTPTDNNMKYCCYCGKLLKQED